MQYTYDELLHMPHPVSKKHKHMSNHDRAAQFAPFAALAGYSEAITETGRKTEKFLELSEDEKDALDYKLTYLQETGIQDIPITLTYFLEDSF